MHPYDTTILRMKNTICVYVYILADEAFFFICFLIISYPNSIDKK